MSLDDQEQKILAEIERQFYEEDPELARAVKDIRRPTRISFRLALIGVVSGLAVVIGFFTTNIIAAFLGFGLLLGSATALVHRRSRLARGAVIPLSRRPNRPNNRPSERWTEQEIGLRGPSPAGSALVAATGYRSRTRRRLQRARIAAEEYIRLLFQGRTKLRKGISGAVIHSRAGVPVGQLHSSSVAVLGQGATGRTIGSGKRWPPRR